MKTANLTHLWFNGWPEFGVPKKEEALKSFEQIIEEATNLLCADEDQGKPLIHCRSGYGRSGTFLALAS